MKLINRRWFFVFTLFAGVLFSCGKTADTPDNVTPDDPIIGGATSEYKDTTQVTVDDLVIKYSRTSQCFPSNEIFAFSATKPNLPNGAVATWTFGDGKTLNGLNVKHIYEFAGAYTVILEIKDSKNNLIAKASFSLRAFGQQVTPKASFYAQIYDVNVLNNYSFTSQSSVPRGNLTNFQWNWADGNISNTAAPFAQYNFPQVPQDKIYPVKLVVTANSGCKDSTTVNVSVPAVYSITGNFDIQSFDVCTNEYFILTPNLVGAPANVTYVWDFADASGIVRTTGPVKKFFTYQNDYDVKLTVQLNGKTIYQTSRWVRANGQNIRPKALFLKNEVVADANSETWAFYSQSNIPHGFFTGYRWEFDDGRVDDNFNTYVEHKYTKQATEKTYKVLFIVTGNTGCKDTATGFVTIPPR